MRICIYGAGAVGGVMAGRLARAGHDVSVVARAANLEAIRAQGLRVEGEEGVETFAVRADAEPVKLGPQDCVVVAVKAQSLGEVARSIGPLVGPDTTIVTAMNGVPWWLLDRLPARDLVGRLESLDPEGRLASAMPTERVVGCVIHFAATIVGPGLVRHTGGRSLIVGEPGGANGARTSAVADALSGAGFTVDVSDCIEKDYWIKLLGNVTFNPLSALTLSVSDRLIANPEVNAYMVAIMREGLAIGRAVGIDADIDPDARIEMARALGPFKTSMLQDLEAGKELEIDGLLAGTLEIARKAGVPAPFTESLYGLIKARVGR